MLYRGNSALSPVFYCSALMQMSAFACSWVCRHSCLMLPADFADWLDFVAIGTLLAFVWKAPSYANVFLAVGMGAPYLIVGPFAGALVDRLPIRTVLFWSNLGRALAIGALFFASSWVGGLHRSSASASE